MRRDQGIGDEIFFLRYARHLLQRGARVTYLSSPALAPLLPLMECCDKVITETPQDNYDYIVSVADLPLVLNEPKPVPPVKLALNPDTLLRFKSQYGLDDKGIKRIGVTWRAGMDSHNSVATTLKKHIPLAKLCEYLQEFQGEVIILQREPQAEEIRFLEENLPVPVRNFSSFNHDLLAMAHLLDTLDNYLGVSNTNMHIRGMLRKPATVLIPFPPEWRWGVTSVMSAWYPEFNLIRCDAKGGWPQSVSL